jgi:hypothetical protein
VKRFWFFCVALILSFSASAFSQTTFPASMSIVAPKTTFVFGEPIKLNARVRDNLGALISGTSVGWSVDPPGAATVASDGTVTPLQLQIIAIKAQYSNLSSEIQIQILPKRIDVMPQRETMTVGLTQAIRAAAIDYNDKPIPGVVFRWSLSNLLRGFDPNNPMATVDGGGQMKALVQGTVMVAATLDFNAGVGFLNQARGEAIVDMRAPLTYNFTRVFAADNQKATSKLTPRLAQLTPTDDGFVFAGSLDSVGLSLLRYQNGGITSLLSEGRPHITTGQPLIDIQAYAANHFGQIMTQEVDSISQVEISIGPLESQTPLFVPNTPLFLADRTFGYGIQRGSLSDTGSTLVTVNYSEVDTLKNANGLFRGTTRGLNEKIISTLDKLPGYPNDVFGFRSYGIATDGLAWFTTSLGADNSRFVLWRQQPFGPLERVLGDGDAFQGATVRSIGNNGSGATQTAFFVGHNGDLITTVFNGTNTYFTRWPATSTTPTVLRGGGSMGIYWHEPGVGTLIYSNQPNATGPGQGQGLYLWTTGTDVRPLLLLNAPLDGSTVTDIQSAAVDNKGVAYAMVATANNPMLIVQLLPSVKVLLRSGDTVPVSVPPVISSIVRGVRPGRPVVIAGGQLGSIAELASDGTLQPLIPIGAPLPGGKFFKGSLSNQVRTFATGEIIFSDSSTGNGLYLWKDGTISLLVANAITVGGVQINSPNALDVNVKGEVAVAFTGTGTGIYRLFNGDLTKILRLGDSFNGGTVTSFRTPPAIDDTGRIAFYVVTDKGEYLALWNQGTLSPILSDGMTLPDGRTVQRHDSNIISTNDGFLLPLTASDGQSTILKFGINFEFVIGRADRTPAGGLVQSINNWSTNRTGSITLFYFGNNGNSHLIAKRSGAFQEIQDWGEITPEQDLLVRVASLFMNDDGTVYALVTDDTGQQLIYKGTPINGFVEVPFTANSFGGLTLTTAGAAAVPTIGYAGIDSRSTLPAVAIFGLRQNGVLVGETAVPALQPITAGRIYAEVAGVVNTGIAIANTSNDPAVVNYYLTRIDGSQLKAGSLTLGAGRQIASFLDQAPYYSGSNFAGTFSFTSNVPIAVIALRGYTNLRGEFLTSTLPVVNVSSTPSSASSVIPSFSLGGGWTTQVFLVNPSDAPLNGTLQFYSAASDNLPGVLTNVTLAGQTNSSFPYTIQPRASIKLSLTSTSSETTNGTIRVVPGAGQVAPVSQAVFTFTNGNIVVTEAGVAGVVGTGMQMYAEATGVPFTVGSVQTGLAMANPSDKAVTVILDLRKLDGSSAGVTASTISIPANGRVSKFLYELFPTLPRPFQGVVRMIADAPISAIGLRTRTNERTDFLITTTAPSPLATSSTAAGSLVFPHLVDGGGYTTQIIIIGNGAGDYPGTMQLFGQSGLPLPLTFR